MSFLKKIVYFLDFPLTIGGASKVLLTQAFIMSQRGFQVLVVIPQDEEKKHAAEYDELCLKYNLETTTAYYHVAVCMENINVRKALLEYQSIAELLIKYKPDFIHSNQLNISVELAARELQIPHLMNIYQADRASFHISWLKIFPMYHSADSLMFSKRWCNGLKIPSECIRVAYKEKECIAADSGWKCGSEIGIITMGVVCERKNQLETIKFILKCKEKGYNVKLLILGSFDNPYGKSCKEFVEENKLQSDVIFKGFVLNIEAYLKSADLFLLASKVESYPGVIVESMANHIPVISTAVAGVPELLEDGINGFLAGGCEAEDIYDTFLRFMDCRSRGGIPDIVRNAYSTYLEHHTYEKVGNKLESYYQWISEDYLSKGPSYLKADDIRNIFDSFTIEKNLENFFPGNLIWFLYHVFSIIQESDSKKIVIWGAGFWGKAVLEWIQSIGLTSRFAGFVDKNKCGTYLGYLIVKGNELTNLENSIILVAIADERSRLDIMNDLEKYGKVRNKDFFLLFNFWEPVNI